MSSALAVLTGCAMWGVSSALGTALGGAPHRARAIIDVLSALRRGAHAALSVQHESRILVDRKCPHSGHDVRISDIMSHASEPRLTGSFGS